jgi:hypothetical protein
MGEDKATAVAALVSPEVLVAMQPLIQSMYDDSGINSLIETEDAAPQMQQGAAPQMQPPQAVPGMAKGGIVKLQTGGLADIDPYEYLRPREEPDWDKEEIELTKKYEDVGTSAMDKEELQGIILMDVAKQILSLGARGEGTVVDKFIKGAQSTSDLVQQLSISQGKIKGAEKRESRLKAIEKIADLKTDFKEQKYKKQEARSKLISTKEDVWDKETNSPVRVSKWEQMIQPDRYTPKRKKGTVMKGTYNYAQDPNVIEELNKIENEEDRAKAKKALSQLGPKQVDMLHGGEGERGIWVPDIQINDDGTISMKFDKDTGAPGMRLGHFGLTDVYVGATVDIKDRLKMSEGDRNDLIEDYQKTSRALASIKTIKGLARQDPTRVGTVADFKRWSQTWGQLLAKDLPGILEDVNKQALYGIDKQYRQVDLLKNIQTNEKLRDLMAGEWDPLSEDATERYKAVQKSRILDLQSVDLLKTEEEKQAQIDQIKTKYGVGEESPFTEDIIRENFEANKEGIEAFNILSRSENQMKKTEFDKALFTDPDTGVYNKGLADQVYKNIFEINHDPANFGNKTEFDAALPAIRSMIQNIVYTIARIRKPNGRLNKDDIQRAALQLEGFKSSKDVLAVLTVFEREMEKSLFDQELKFFRAQGGRAAGDAALLRDQYSPFGEGAEELREIYKEKAIKKYEMKGPNYPTQGGVPIPGEGFSDFFYNKETGGFDLR